MYFCDTIETDIYKTPVHFQCVETHSFNLYT